MIRAGRYGSAGPLPADGFSPEKDPIVTRHPRDIIRDTEARFPMPEGEIRRLEDRRWVLELLPKGGVGMEVGVFRGHFSALICDIVRPRKLYLVDPWTTIGETFGWGKAYTNFDTLTTAAARDEAAARVALYPGTECALVESMYPTCADRIADPLDWAYLDASHKYQSTLNELRVLDRQVKPDGMILGDDWDPRPEAQHHGVYVAIREFLSEGRWDLVKAGPGRQWAIRRTGRG